MEYREWQPPAGLEEVVSCLWMRVVPGIPATGQAPPMVLPAAGQTPTMVLPDACADLIWSSERGAFIAGPDTRPAPVTLAAGTVLVGARFRPGAGGPVLGLSLARLQNLRIDAAEVSPALARQLPAGLDAEKAEQRISEVVAELAAASPLDQEVGEATRLLALPGMTVPRLARALYLSERQLRRRFDAAVGYGPKMLQRVLRFRNLLARLQQRPLDLARVASDLGYADQAHLTREARELSGLTPTELACVNRSRYISLSHFVSPDETKWETEQWFRFPPPPQGGCRPNCPAQTDRTR